MITNSHVQSFVLIDLTSFVITGRRKKWFFFELRENMSRLIDKILSSHGLKRQKHVIGSAKQTFFSLNSPSMFFSFSSSIFKIAFPKWLITSKILQSLFFFKSFFIPNADIASLVVFENGLLLWAHICWRLDLKFIVSWNLFSNLTFKTSIILQLQHFLS